MNGRGAYRVVTLAFSVSLMVLGLVAIVRTAVAGGDGVALGYVIGVGFLVVGGLRLYVLRRT